MTSGTFKALDIESIAVSPERQRQDLGDISDLRESIRRTGLIHPIVVTRDSVLVAGERRLTACKQLGFTHIPAQFADTLDPVELELIELEENTRRLDLSWQEQTRAVERYHRLRRQLSPDWKADQTAEALGVTKQSIYQHLAVAKELAAGTPLVVNADKFSVAKNVTTRRIERRAAAVLRDLAADIELPERPFSLLQADFTEWAPTYTGPRFNFIHCDFPYGIGADKHDQGAADKTGGYEDTPELFFRLLHTIVTAENLIAESAHLMFWFSMEYYEETRLALRVGGWNVLARPLIWHKSDNTGIMSDKDRRPRNVYETAFMASRGDRKIVSSVSDAVFLPVTKIYHMSEKPQAVLDHFFRMFVDEYTRLLDPTCGSGMAVKVAEARGAVFSLGIERDPEFYAGAEQNLGMANKTDLQAIQQAQP